MSDNKAPDKAIMNKVYKDFGLTRDHIFDHRHYKIITRAGIDKIQAAANIKVEYEVVKINISDEEYIAKRKTRDGIFDAQLVNKGDVNAVVMKAVGRRYDKDGVLIGEVTTFGEASPSNCDNAYLVAMAEKRGMSRAVLKLSGLYEEGHFSEDEADDFKEAVRVQRKAVTVRGN